jgi:ubiquinone/menaquinone biosynthesis C-methylase UbiE
MTDVHRVAKTGVFVGQFSFIVRCVGFELQADAYDNARPSYPTEAVDDIVEKLRLTKESKVLDLASGTGIFTKLLVQRGLNVDACEPASEMRRKFRESLPDVQVFEGTATCIPIEGGTYDVVVAAQAFHWFDNVDALKEIHRVLKKNGSLVLIWNMEDREKVGG